MTILLHALRQLRRRKARQDLSAFAALIETPANLSTGVTLPANAPLHASLNEALAGTTVVIDVSGGRALGLPAGAAGRTHSIGFLEADKTLTRAAGSPGTASLYVEDGLGALHKIAEG